MATTASRRWQLIEYADPVPLVTAISDATSRPRHEVRDLLIEAGERAARTLAVQDNPIRVTGDMVRATNIAGLLLLRPGLELEIAPKFLGDAERWREDFFLIANLAQHGKLLERDGISAAASRDLDLPTILARALLDMYWANHRRPLRTYRGERTRSFAIEGDFDAMDLLAPDEDGFEQVVTSYSRSNEFNGVIRAAALTLAPEVGDAETRMRLERLGHVLPRQPFPIRLEAKRLPGRAQAWQGLYDLSLDILRGLGGSYDRGGIRAPGYILNTWQAWEALLTITLRTALGGGALRSQHDYRLGIGTRGSGAIRAVSVTPDIVVLPRDPSEAGFIVDAKYKGRVGRGSQSVDSADVYEALAFSMATGHRSVVLAYPRVPRPGPVPSPGDVSLVERIVIEEVTITAVDVAVSGISGSGSVRRFGRALADGLAALMSHGVTSASPAQAA